MFVLKKTDKHPKSMCDRCYKRLSNFNLRANMGSEGSEARENTAEIIRKGSLIWTEYDPSLSISQCTVCCHFASQCKAGRPLNTNTQAKKRQLPDDTSMLSSEAVSSPVRAASSTVDTGTSPVRAAPSTVEMGTSPIRAVPSAVETGTSPMVKQYRNRPVDQLSAPLSAQEELVYI